MLGPGNLRTPTFVMTVWPSWLATKSFTFDGGAFSSLFPPMKWSGRLCFAAYDAVPLTGAPCRLPVPFVSAIAAARAQCGQIRD